MNSEYSKKISCWITSVKNVARLNYLAVKFLSLCTILVCTVFGTLLVDNFVYLPFVFRDKFTLILIISLAAMSIFHIIRSRNIDDDKAVNLATKKFNILFDDLPNAYSFISEPENKKVHSLELEEKFIQFTFLKLEKISVNEFIDKKRIISCVRNFIASVLILAVSIFAPFTTIKNSLPRLFKAGQASGIGQFIKLETASMKIPHGGDAQIKVKILSQSYVEVYAKKLGGKNKNKVSL